MLNWLKPSANHAVEGRVIWVLILITLVQFSYPISANNETIPLLIYQLLYASLMIAGIIVSRDKPIAMRWLIFLGLAWIFFGVIYNFNQEAIWAILIGYSVIVVFQGMVIRVLMEYIFQALRVTRDVIYAAISVYLLLGAVFVPIYGLLEALTYETTGEHAFSEPTVGEDDLFPWQHFAYFSFVTLTTAGYGDILPVSMWARSFASIEAVIGVLYLTIIMARLVGLYATREVEEDIGEQGHLAVHKTLTE